MLGLKSYLPNILNGIQIFAIAFLIWKILQPSSASEKLDKIEQHQLQIEASQKALNAAQTDLKESYDSLSKIQTHFIDSLTESIDKGLNDVSKQASSIYKRIDELRRSRPDLPDPDAP